MVDKSDTGKKRRNRIFKILGIVMTIGAVMVPVVIGVLVITSVRWVPAVEEWVRGRVIGPSGKREPLATLLPKLNPPHDCRTQRNAALGITLWYAEQATALAREYLEREDGCEYATERFLTFVTDNPDASLFDVLAKGLDNPEALRRRRIYEPWVEALGAQRDGRAFSPLSAELDGPGRTRRERAAAQSRRSRRRLSSGRGNRRSVCRRTNACR